MRLNFFETGILELIQTKIQMREQSKDVQGDARIHKIYHSAKLPAWILAKQVINSGKKKIQVSKKLALQQTNNQTNKMMPHKHQQPMKLTVEVIIFAYFKNI